MIFPHCLYLYTSIGADGPNIMQIKAIITTLRLKQIKKRAVTVPVVDITGNVSIVSSINYIWRLPFNQSAHIIDVSIYLQEVPTTFCGRPTQIGGSRYK